MRNNIYKERFLGMYQQLQNAFPGMRVAVAWYDEQNTPLQTREILRDIIEKVDAGSVDNWPLSRYLLLDAQLSFGFLNWTVKDEAGKMIKIISGKKISHDSIGLRRISKESPIFEPYTVEECNSANGMIVAYGIAGCIIMQKPFRECLNWYGVDPEGEGMRTFRERYNADKKLFLLIKGRVINKCNLWSELFLESYPTIETSLVLLLTGKYRDEFRRITIEEREGVEIFPEWPGVQEYIQEILEDYYDFRKITTLKVISGPPAPESSLDGENSIHKAIYENSVQAATAKPEKVVVPEEVPTPISDKNQLQESFFRMLRTIGDMHTACLELSIRLLDIGLKFLFGIR